LGRPIFSWVRAIPIVAHHGWRGTRIGLRPQGGATSQGIPQELDSKSTGRKLEDLARLDSGCRHDGRSVSWLEQAIPISPAELVFIYFYHFL
jgi:hypothetical protein